ncbi:MAG: Na(+)/H(+) antiporter subunit B [Thermoplasmatota archaeon]
MMERSVLQRSLPALALALLFAATLIVAFVEVDFGVPRVDEEDSVANRYVSEGNNETGSANLVTAVVVNYRGFDTLGEVTVLFLAATGVGALLTFIRKDGDEKKKEKGLPPSLILNRGARLVLPLIVVFGVYVFLHGHLSPGGGFQGGVIIASGMLLFFIAESHRKASHRVISWIESTAGLSFIGLGLVGLMFGSKIFLANDYADDWGEVGMLVSAGLLPLIYIAIGFKVGSEMTGLVDRMRGDGS